MHRKSWTVLLEGGIHTIELEEDEKPWGERSLSVDGHERFRTRKRFVDHGRVVQFELAGHRCSAHFEYGELNTLFRPECLVAGRMINNPWDGMSLPKSAARAIEPIDFSLFPRGSTSHKLWRFKGRSQRHRIELYHAWFSGQLHVRVDGAALVQGERPIESRSTLQLLVGGRICVIDIEDFGMERLYECTIDREIVFSDAHADTLLRATFDPTLSESALLRPSIATEDSDRHELLRPERL
jgi:hypothetical protein